MLFDHNVPVHGQLDPIPSLRIDGRLPKEMQLQSALDLYRQVYDIDPAFRLHDVNIDSNLWVSDSFALSRSHWDGLNFRRDPNRHLGREILQIKTILSGYEKSDAIEEITQNAVDISTTDVEAADTVVGANVANFYVPFEAIGYDPSRHKQQFSFGLESSKGRLIGAAILDVTSRMPHTASQDVPRMVEEITDLFRDIILKNRKEVNLKNVIRARRLAMNAFIEQHIQNGSLGSASLVHEFSVSRASLYRMFEEDGGVVAYISKRRLYRALLSLKTEPLTRGAVRQVSEKYGFVDSATFSRSFKREFGFKPSDVLGMNVCDIR